MSERLPRVRASLERLPGKPEQGSAMSGAELIQQFEHCFDLEKMTSDTRTADVETELELLHCCSRKVFL